MVLWRSGAAWLPVVAWLLIIALNSTGLASEERMADGVTGFLAVLGVELGEDAGEDGEFDDIFFWTRKLGHLIQYGILAFLVFRALGRSGLERIAPAALLALAFAVLVGLLDELHQAGVPSRSGELGDVAIDAGGAVLGLVIASIRRLRRL